MAIPRTLVLRSPGANCDEETEHAFRLAGSEVSRLHVNRLLDNPGLLSDYQVLCIPGGFSYGDDIASGRILANQIRQRLAEPLQAFRDSDRLILGVCNGFQVLARTGLLDLDDEQGAMATLFWNNSARFQAHWVSLEGFSELSVFTRGVGRLELPIAHAEGRVVVRDPDALASLVKEDRLALTYTTENGSKNPNGSAGDAAGLCDKTGRVLGLMPHPERYVVSTQHPRWTRGENAGGEGQGMPIFRNAVGYFS